MSGFTPRTSFPILEQIPRSYFLGHHRSGLNDIRSMLSQTDLVLECRDYRVPVSSQNPLLDEALLGKQRLIVHTKQDLGTTHSPKDRQRERLLRASLLPSSSMFLDVRNHRSVRRILEFASERTRQSQSITGVRMMIVGMPNVGKSSLLNALRHVGLGKGKAAHIGAQPGITRKVATPVKISEDSGSEGGIYLLDTPGVFIPFVQDSETMLKLALCAIVKDSILAPIILADYLLYRVNLFDPKLYSEYSHPTNDIHIFLESVAMKTGKLRHGANPDLDAAAVWMIQRWRNGKLGRFVLDRVPTLDLEVPLRIEAESNHLTRDPSQEPCVPT